MESEAHSWASILISCVPFLLLIGFWIFFMKKLGGGKQAKYMERSQAFMDRQEQLLERIATALEQRNMAGQ